MKFLVVTMPDNSRWAISTKFIAKHRVRYYAKRDSEMEGNDYDKTFDIEFAYTLEDDYELVDWASNNMYWKDIADVALRLADKPSWCDYGKEWTNVDKVVIEVGEDDLSLLLGSTSW